MWKDSTLIWKWKSIETGRWEKIDPSILWDEIEGKKYVIFYDYCWKITLDCFFDLKVNENMSQNSWGKREGRSNVENSQRKY